MSDDAATPRPREVACDLLVIGSGAAGLSAAVTAAFHELKVIVVEKDAVCGGATAWSGGWMYVPCNAVSQADGVIEDRAMPRTYLRHELGENYDAARVEAFLDAGPRMVEFFEKQTQLQFVLYAAGSDQASVMGGVSQQPLSKHLGARAGPRLEYAPVGLHFSKDSHVQHFHVSG